jgi:hypothetical protein
VSDEPELDDETKQAIAEAAAKALTPEALAEAAKMAEKMTRFAQVVGRVRMSVDRKVTVTLEPHECESLMWGMQILRAGPSDA